MAIFHLRVRTIGRSNGDSAVAAAARQAGERLHDRRTGRTWNHARRQGVERTFVVAPEGADWTAHRNSLWNAAEAAETRRNATVAREWLLALPAELEAADRAELARCFAAVLVARQGVAVDVAIHAPSETGDGRNHHAHLLATTRVVDGDGLGAKTRVLDDRRSGRAEILALRAAWAALVNEALARVGSEARVDHRSLAAQREAAVAAGDAVGAALLDRRPSRHRGPKREHAACLAAVRAAQIAAERAERERAEAAARAVAEHAAAAAAATDHATPAPDHPRARRCAARTP